MPSFRLYPDDEGRLQRQAEKEANCTHRWNVDSIAHDKKFAAVCVRCGKKRTFPLFEWKRYEGNNG